MLPNRRVVKKANKNTARPTLKRLRSAFVRLALNWEAPAPPESAEISLGHSPRLSDGTLWNYLIPSFMSACFTDRKRYLDTSIGGEHWCCFPVFSKKQIGDWIMKALVLIFAMFMSATTCLERRRASQLRFRR